MKTPESLETLADYGIIQQVVRPLMSGKEAQVFIVVSDGKECVAKVYKEAIQRTFKHRAEYTEGRKTRNTRDQRAINKRTRHGKKQDEAAWRNAEVDTLYRLQDGGVRVPEPFNFVDGVLVMELVRDAEGDPAPRLGDLEFTAEKAYEVYKQLIREVVRMLCVGTVHGDLSEFNVLMAADGPVVIDFPQSIDPAKNTSARKLLLRDVENLHRFLSRHAPDQPIRPLGEEMWALYEKNRLSHDTELLGDYKAPTGPTELTEVLALIDEAKQERLPRYERLDDFDGFDDDDRFSGVSGSDPRDSSAAPSGKSAGGESETPAPPAPLRRVVDFTESRSGARAKSGSAKPGSGASRRPDRSGDAKRKTAKRGRSGQGARSSERSREPNRPTDAAPPSGPASLRPGSPRRRDRAGRTDRPERADSRAEAADSAKSTRNEISASESAPKKRRRRRRRSPNRAESDSSSVASPSGAPATRPPTAPKGPAASTGTRSKSPGDEAAKPRRPRRRRPRKPRTSED